MQRRFWPALADALSVTVEEVAAAARESESTRENSTTRKHASPASTERLSPALLAEVARITQEAATRGRPIEADEIRRRLAGK
jgi:hypothetical protein